LDTRVMIIPPSCVAVARRENGKDYWENSEKRAHARLMHESFS
jgi:hypothetical protein